LKEQARRRTMTTWGYRGLTCTHVDALSRTAVKRRETL
jgi:hypothetical protein